MLSSTMSDSKDVEDISEENQAKHECQILGGKENKNLTQDGRVSRSPRHPTLVRPRVRAVASAWT